MSDKPAAARRRGEALDQRRSGARPTGRQRSGHLRASLMATATLVAVALTAGSGGAVPLDQGTPLPPPAGPAGQPPNQPPTGPSGQPPVQSPTGPAVQPPVGPATQTQSQAPTTAASPTPSSPAAQPAAQPAAPSAAPSAAQPGAQSVAPPAAQSAAQAVVQPALPAGPLADPGLPGPYAVAATRRSFIRTASASDQPRLLETVIWYPALLPERATPDPQLRAPLDAPPDRAGAPYPVVLFSHGSGGTPWQSTFFTLRLASHGFVVVAPPHPGNTLADCPPPCLPSTTPNRGMFADSARDRPEDITFVLDRLTAQAAGEDPVLAGLIDLRRVGVSGHSFGGYTALAVGAQDSRISAVVAMAAGIGPMSPASSRGIQAPVMLMAGLEDRLVSYGLIQTVLASLGSSGADRWLVTLTRGGHFSFADICPRQAAGCQAGDLPPAQAHGLIDRWATAFLLRHVARDDRYEPLLDPSLAAGDPELQLQRLAGS